MGKIPRTIKAKLGFYIQAADTLFLFKSLAIAAALRKNENGFYDPPFEELDKLDSAIDKFSKKLDKMKFGAPGRTGKKNAAKGEVNTYLFFALNYINLLCRQNQEHATTIITGAKMEVIKWGSINKKDFDVRNGPGTGCVTLISLAAKFKGKRIAATYEWEYSLDEGITWTALIPTHVAKTIAKNMPVNKIVYFRKRVTTVKSGTSDWCTKKRIAVT